MNELLNDPKLTAMALGEMSEQEAKTYKDELIAKGVNENEIKEEVENIIDFQRRLGDEFSKDQKLRLESNNRESILASSTPWYRKKWVMGLGVTTACGLVIFQTLDIKRGNVVDPTTVFTRQETESVSETLSNALNDVGSNPSRPVRPLKEDSKGKARKSVRHDAELAGAGSAGAPAGMKRAQGISADSDSFAFRDAAKPQTFAKISNKRLGNMIGQQVLPTSPVEAEAPSRESYDHIETNKYVSVSAEPLSTFSIDVDTASYANVRRFLSQGMMPPKHSVRVEELINYFPYDYKIKMNEHPIGVKVDHAESPFHKGRRLVRVAMEAAMPPKKLSKNLVFLLDVSGSMNAQNKLPLLKESIKILMRELRPDDTLSLVVYAGAAGVVLEPTPVSERFKIIQALNQLNAGGSTNGGAGIVAAYKLAKEAFKKNGVNRVILATDGDFNVGTSNRGGLVDLVKDKAQDDIFLTVLGFGMGNYQDALLEELSNKGNGNYAYIDSLSEANKVFRYDLEKNLTTVAKDVKIQVEFNPKFVQAYRLIGYENRKMAAQDFNDDKKDAGEVGAGHTVTALYEVIENGEKMALPEVDDLKYGNKVVVKNDSNEILNVKVRYKNPSEKLSTKFEVPLKYEELSKLEGDREMLFATSVAAFGMKLRGDQMTQDTSFDDIKKWAKNSKGDDELKMREEFIDLIDFAKNIQK